MCDYDHGTEPRSMHDFLTAGRCLLCGQAPCSTVEEFVFHTKTDGHQSRYQQYSLCSRQLLLHEKSSIDDNFRSVSRREVILAYLGSRIARAEIVRGVGAFNTQAVNFLLRRCNTPELMSSFRDIVGTPQSETKGLCSVCMECTSTVVFEACRHLCVCLACSRRLQQPSCESKAKCPICRVESETTHVFIT